MTESKPQPLQAAPPGDDASTPNPSQDGGPRSDPDASEVPGSLRGWDRYEVKGLIGVGGMGRVYRAEDRRLKRPVALKFLRGGDAAVEARFEREAQAQARVQHQNVCAVYEVGRYAGHPYIAMQLIEGKTLRECARELAVRDRVRVLRDVAEAVHAGHEKSLVHRDIKPANILVEQRGEKVIPFVTDFGLARDLEGPAVTQAGAIIGTPQYMAPEQVRGEPGKIDARTDVYGLGATLYDALAGVPPFSGSSNLQTLYRTLNEDATPLRSWNRELPPSLEAVVMKCLEKRPERRYATAKELADDLTRWLEDEPVLARPQSSVKRLGRRFLRSRFAPVALLLAIMAAAALAVFLSRDPPEPALVAVADFMNETRDPELDGLSGMLITALEQSPRLSVLTRTRMRDLLRFRMARDEARIDEQLGREAAREANADALLVSTIRRFDDLYRIELRALDPKSGAPLFTLSEEGTGKARIPALIDALSSQARRKLRSRATQSAPAVSSVTTDNLEAYQHYFRGEELIERLRFREAREELKKAVAADEGFALAWYRLGYASMWLKDAQGALQNVEKAVALIQRVPEREKSLVLALEATMKGNGAQAAAEYQKCLARFPQEKEAAFNLGDLAYHGGAYGPSEQLLKRTLELDPAHERALQHLISLYQLTSKTAEMVETAKLYAQRLPGLESRAHLGRALGAAGDRAAARKTFEESQRLSPESPLPLADLSTLDALEGDFAAAEARVQPLLAPGKPVEGRLFALQAIAESQTLSGRAAAAHATLDKLADEARASGDLDLAAQARATQGFNEVQLLRSPTAAHATVERTLREGLPDPVLGFVYPYVGEFDRYRSMLASLGDPNVATEEQAFQHRAADKYALAIDLFDRLGHITPWQDILLFEAGYAAVEAHRGERAVAELQQVVALWPSVSSRGIGVTVAVRPRALFELGRAQELLADARQATASYKKLLDQWKRADPTLPDLVEARARVQRLSGMPAQR